MFYTQSVVSGPKIEVPEVLSKCFPRRGTLKFALFYLYFNRSENPWKNSDGLNFIVSQKTLTTECLCVLYFHLFMHVKYLLCDLLKMLRISASNPDDLQIKSGSTDQVRINDPIPHFSI